MSACAVIISVKISSPKANWLPTEIRPLVQVAHGTHGVLQVRIDLDLEIYNFNVIEYSKPCKACNLPMCLGHNLENYSFSQVLQVLCAYLGVATNYSNMGAFYKQSS